MIRQAPRPSEWMTIDQPRIDTFAEATGDDAFIHVDPQRAAATRFGGTIAHGLLTLSVLPYLLRSAMPRVSDARMGVNYGYDKVRFLAPVSVGARIRALVGIDNVVEDRPGFATVAYDVQVEIEGAPLPALAARWLIGYWVRADAATL